MEAVQPHDVVRLQTSALAAAEKRLLVRMAERLPARVNSDHLTALGAAGMILAGASYWFSSAHPVGLLLAVVCLGINWFGDSLDGTVARVRQIERPRYGFYIDHVIDAFSEVLIFLGIGLSPYVNFNIACVALVGYLMLSILVYITTYVNGVFRISYIRLGPTEMRVIAILANTVVFFLGNPMLNLPFGPLSFYNLVALLLALLFYGAFIVVGWIQAVELAKIDRKKP